MCPSVIKGCCSRMGNKSCPSITWCLAAAVAGGACNLSFRNQWGGERSGSRKGNVTCPSVIRGTGSRRGNLICPVTRGGEYG